MRGTEMNAGIDHIALKTGGFPLCRSNRAIMSISVETFRADEGTGRYCARCVASLAKRDAKKTKTEAA